MGKAVKTSPAKNVDEYLRVLPAAVRSVLEKMRQAIKAAAPKAEEIISYRVPTYKYMGPLVHFAAFKDHSSLIVVNKNILKTFKKELGSYKTSGTTIHFTPDKPVPAMLIKKIVKQRIRENEERNAVKKLIAMAKDNKEKDITKPGRQKPVNAKGTKAALPAVINAKRFVERLKALQSAEELKKIQRYFKSGKGEYGEGDQFMGVKMGQLFALAKEFNGMPVSEIEKLLESPIHEIRAGGISIMDKESRIKKITESRRKEFYELYMRRHDRVNNWDLVDLGCLHMTGSYLFDKPRDILYKLARSKNIWERRTAILSTCYFIRQGDVGDTFKIAEILVNDKEDLIHKATGWMLRTAGGNDRTKLLRFLDKHAATMPRTLLRYSIEKLDKKQREHYLSAMPSRSLRWRA